MAAFRKNLAHLRPRSPLLYQFASRKGIRVKIKRVSDWFLRFCKVITSYQRLFTWSCSGTMKQKLGTEGIVLKLTH